MTEKKKKEAEMTQEQETLEHTCENCKHWLMAGNETNDWLDEFDGLCKRINSKSGSGAYHDKIHATIWVATETDDGCDNEIIGVDVDKLKVYLNPPKYERGIQIQKYEEGIQIQLHTHKKFGCVLFESKQ